MNRRAFLASASFTPLIVSEEPWDQHIYISERLLSEAGHSPLHAAVEHVSAAFDESGINFEITAHCDPIALENSDTACGDAYAEWNGYDLDGDSNVCLTAAKNGGCGQVGGNMAMAGAKHLDSTGHEWVRDDFYGLNIHTILHEICHNAGIYHDDRLGRAWGEKGPLNVTPATSPVPSAGFSDCGHWVPKVEQGNRVFHHYFTDCTADQFKKEKGSVEPVTEITDCC